MFVQRRNVTCCSWLYSIGLWSLPVKKFVKIRNWRIWLFVVDISHFLNFWAVGENVLCARGCVYVCVCMRLCERAREAVCLHARTRLFMCACARMRGCACACVSVWVRVRACICVYLFKGHLTFWVLELGELFIPDVVRMSAHCRKLTTVQWIFSVFRM
jgi:hypothetical protein